MNGQYIGRMSPTELSAALAPRLAEAGLADTPIARDPQRFGRLLELLRPRAKRLPDFIEQARPLLMDEVEYTQEAIEKHLSTPGLSDHMHALARRLADGRAVRRATRSRPRFVTPQRRWASRPARSSTPRAWPSPGAPPVPGLFEVLALLGRETDARPPGPSAAVSSGARLKDSHAAGESSADLHAAQLQEPYANHIALQRLRNEPRQVRQCEWRSQTSLCASRANTGVAHPLHPLSSQACACSPLRVPGTHWSEVPHGQRRSRVCIDGPDEAARDRQQGRARGARQGHRARVERRGSSRGRPQRRAGEPPQAPAAAGRLVLSCRNSPCDGSLAASARLLTPLRGASLRPPIGSRYSWRFVALKRREPTTGRSFNGRTRRSGRRYRGSNPCLPANSFGVGLVGRFRGSIEPRFTRRERFRVPGLRDQTHWIWAPVPDRLVSAGRNGFSQAPPNSPTIVTPSGAPHHIQGLHRGGDGSEIRARHASRNPVRRV